MNKHKSKASEAYLAKLRDPRWQRKRLEIMNRDGFSCQSCFDTESTLSVHHRFYDRGKDPWEYPDEALVTLCQECHEIDHQYENAPADLIRSLRFAGFLNSDINDLWAGFANIQATKSHDVQASILCYALSTRSVMEMMEKAYFDHLAALSERVQEAKNG